MTSEATPFWPRQRQRYVNLILDTVIVVAAVLGGLAAASSSSAPTGPRLQLADQILIACALGLAVRLLWRSRVQHRGVLGAALTARTLVIAGTGLLLGRDDTLAEVLGAALGAALLIAGVAGEPYLRRAARFNPPVVANLPGVASAPRYRSLRGWVVGASLAATLVGVLLAVLGASSWWWPLAAALALVPPAVVAVRGRRQILTARRLRREVPKAVADYAPEFVVYTSRPDDASYQITMWLPYLQRSGRPPRR